MKRSLSLLVVGLLAGSALAQNPYLPLWEYIPDGEPYVFEDPDNPGHERVYIYGSHDDEVTTYCGRDQVVWSAPVEDLTNWERGGVILRQGHERESFISLLDRDGNLLNPDSLGDILYAPDIALRLDQDGRKHYYLYPNNQARGRENMVAESNRPDGPFHVINWSKDDPKRVSGSLYFDPAVFVDDDGRAYAYWGYQESECAELEADMCHIKPETYVKDMIPSWKQPGEHRFFEASSIRKIEDKYVFIYSRMTKDGEDGLPQCNYTLAYAYSDHPMGPFTYGGTLIDGRAKDVDEHGRVIATANPFGNTHGSICLIGDQWWLFYHRQTGTDEFSRQAMVAPVTVEVEKGEGGKVLISEAKYTSEGFMTDGLDPFAMTNAGRACYIRSPHGVTQSFPNFTHTGSYVQPSRSGLAEDLCPVVNNTPGSIVGFRYMNMDQLGLLKNPTLLLSLTPHAKGTIRVVMGAQPWNATEVATINLSSLKTGRQTVRVRCPKVRGMQGKQALYFLFEGENNVSLCDLYFFRFRR